MLQRRNFSTLNPDHRGNPGKGDRETLENRKSCSQARLGTSDLRTDEEEPRRNQTRSKGRGEHPLTAENEGQILRVSAHWVLDMLCGDM